MHRLFFHDKETLAINNYGEFGKGNTRTNHKTVS